MTKRYYFSDPLAAGWMDKHYGMRFDRFRVFHPDDMRIDGYEPRPNEVFIVWTGRRKFYIHPDSIALLEPREGDLVHIVRGFSSHYKTVADVAKGGGKAVTGIWSDGEHWDITTKEPLHDWEIIQRNGIAFHWPESEEV